MSFLKVGLEAIAEVERREEEIKARMNAPRRFWLAPGSSAEVTFLDPMRKGPDGTEYYGWVGIWEHQLYRNGNWNNYYTCLRSGDARSECPLCQVGDKPTYVIYLTVIDHSHYQTKDGKIVVATKKLMPIKRRIINRLKRKAGDFSDGLYLKRFRFTRDSKDEVGTGEDIEFVKVDSIDELIAVKPADIAAEDWVKPFDYEEVFKPLAFDSLARIAGVGGIGSGYAPVPPGHKTEEVTPEELLEEL